MRNSRMNSLSVHDIKLTNINHNKRLHGAYILAGVAVKRKRIEGLAVLSENGELWRLGLWNKLIPWQIGNTEIAGWNTGTNVRTAAKSTEKE